MFTDIDIYRSAKLLLEQHGDDAEFEAAGRVDDMIAQGDVAGESVWKRILAAILYFRKLTPNPGETAH